MKLYKRILSKLSGKRTPSPRQPLKTIVLEHLPLKRNEEEIEQLIKWNQSQTALHFYEWLYAAYIDNDHNTLVSNQQIDFLSYPSIKGFIYHYNEKEHAWNDFKILFDSLSYRVKKLAYSLHQSDYKKVKKNNQILKKYRYYLKPSYDGINWTERIPQKHGNITIELIEAQDSPKYIKFSASVYSDRHYQEAFDFKALLSSLKHQ